MPSEIDRLASALAGHYRIERHLGEGGMALVYLCEDLKHDRKVALKVLKPELAAMLGAERFVKEIKTTASLQHPHILPLFDSGSADGFLYYVMPYIEGATLRDKLNQETQLGLDESVRIARDVADALDYAHRHGVIHRDVKPENILLHDGDALLTDFGIALATTARQSGRLTGTGLSIGTMKYMSPEQATGERHLDARSDIYALGAVTYEMLAGEPPFSGPTPEAIYAKLLGERPTPLHVVRAAVPQSVEDAVMHALAKAPADRFVSARRFADALIAPPAAATPAAHGSGSKSVPVAVAPRRMRAFALVLVLAILSVAGAFAVARSGILTRFSFARGGADSPAVIRSIAVLPLDNFSGDSTQDYFAEGVTGELTAALATISQLRVTSRGSAMQFHGKSRPPTPVIAKTLDVDAIVEGSVARSGDKVRITAQLIDARADRHLWAKSFERRSGDVLALQAELASAIAHEINVHLEPLEQTRLAAAPSVNPEGHDAYLRGRYFFNRPSDENLRKAIAQFEEAVRLSPTFAPAYSGLSDAYLWAGYNEGFLTAPDARPKAKDAAERAVQLDSNSAEAHTSLATFKLFYE
ncbi:MAG: protein kinase, partial [Gemmatimonadales bacterium]